MFLSRALSFYCADFPVVALVNDFKQIVQVAGQRVWLFTFFLTWNARLFFTTTWTALFISIHWKEHMLGLLIGKHSVPRSVHYHRGCVLRDPVFFKDSKTGAGKERLTIRNREMQISLLKSQSIRTSFLIGLTPSAR